jgi:hypothetical protein
MVSWKITSSGASTVRHNQGQPWTESIIDHVYTHHNDGGDQDDVGENNEGPDVE